MTRTLLAKLLKGREIKEVNEYLLAARPYAGSGSSYTLRPRADYDFAEIVLAGILFLFGDRPEILWPETAAHIQDVLLIERGYRIRWTVPGSLGTVRETENHILMTEGTRALRNRWLIRSGADRSPGHLRRTDMHARGLAGFVSELDRCGLYEFNSQPYSGYTLTALVVIHAFAGEPELVSVCQRLLDRLSYQFALSSMGLRRVVPFRRHLVRAHRTGVYEDPMSAAMLVWCGDASVRGSVEGRSNLHHAMVPAAMPYRPGGLVTEWVNGIRSSPLPNGGEGLVLIGRGRRASPEIHWRGNGYMISAGGVSWGRRSSIVARPTVLIKDDGVTDIRGMLRIEGEGECTTWNNTGVHRDLAVGKGTLVVPDGWSAAAESEDWGVYSLGGDGGGWILTYSDRGLALFTVVPDGAEAADVLVRRVQAANRPADLIAGRLVAPDGTAFGYDVNASRGTWVLSTVNGTALDRDCRAWPRLRVVE
jgi:hypothetical protein